MLWPRPKAVPARWNHNIHYHRLVLDAVPSRCRRALDVGCGEGQLTRDLESRAAEVVGIDADMASIEIARERAPANATYVLGDVLSHPFEPASFDLVTSVASLHHMDATAGLERMAELVRPGGVLVVIGCARSSCPADMPWELAAVTLHRFHRLTKAVWEHPSPTSWPPRETYTGMRHWQRRCCPARASAVTCSGATR